MTVTRVVAAAATVMAMLVPALLAQQPPPTQAAQTLQQAIQQQPGLADMLRSRIRESALTAEQVRARLRASGYPANLLDAYLAEPRAGEAVPAPGAQQLAAIQALGLPAISVTVGELPVDTGLVRTVREAEAQVPDTGLQVFGVDVFRRTTTQFLPLLSGPVPPDYRLGPGDLLVLILTGDVELAYSVQVTREGFVVIPQVGQIFVSNLTLEQLRSVLYTRLGRVYSGVRRGAGATTQFDITVANVRAVQVYVVGEVAQPGAFQISALGTVLTALYAAGGVTDRGNTRLIDVRRAGRSVASFDLYDYVLRGNTRNDIRLETGDVIFVPSRGTRASVRGAVVRPAVYELTGRETLTDLVAAAGGFSPDAALRRLSIDRIVPPDRRTPEGPQRVVIDVPLGSATVPPVPVEDGDIVTVFSLGVARRNFVEIRGNVYLPGRFGLEAGMRLSGLVGRAGGLQPATFAGRAHIERLNPADSTRYIIAVALPTDSAAPWPEDPTLEDYDIVTTYGRTEMRDSVTVAIAGMVNRPGVFPWREGMTLRDLVLMARGPRIGAYLQEAEVAHLPADRSGGELATTIRVPLDSTYLFDRDSAGRYVGPPGLPFPRSGAPEVELQPYDNVLILRQPDFELQRTVEIVGEVRFPGAYALRTKSDRLSDLIERAGALTPQAYPQGIRFVRSANNAGRINIDLQRALRDHESRDNVILQPGDSIFIPEYQPSVRVTGAVNSPGSVLWRRGTGLGYYLSAAGGFARNADQGAVSVRQPNGEVRTRGRFLFWRTNPEPGPGAEVIVPAKDLEDRVDYTALFGNIAQVLASMVAIIVVVTR